MEAALVERARIAAPATLTLERAAIEDALTDAEPARLALRLSDGRAVHVEWTHEALRRVLPEAGEDITAFDRAGLEEPEVEAHGLRARAAVVAVAVAGGAATGGAAQAGALMPDGERIDAVRRSPELIAPPAVSGPVPAADEGRGLAVDPALTLAGAGALAIVGAAFVSGRRVAPRPA